MPKIENESDQPAEERTDEDRTVSAVAAAARVGGLVATNLSFGYAAKLDRLPQAIRDSMVIHGVLAHLIGHGMLAPTDALMEDGGWLALDLPDGLRELFEVALDTSVERQERIDAQARGLLAARQASQPPAVQHGRDGWPRDVTLADGVTERPR